MQNMKGLSLDQAPPLQVPFSFFMISFIFGIFLSVSLLLSTIDNLSSRWTVEFLIFNHWLAVGVLLNILLGALFQIFPVALGIAIPRPLLLSRIIIVNQLALLVLLSFGFYTQNWFQWTLSTSLSILFSFFLFLFYLVFTKIKQRRLRNFFSNPVQFGFFVSIFSFLVSFILAFLLLLGHWQIIPLFRPLLTQLHSLWMVAGGFFLLIISVVFQVVPLFFVTPSFAPAFQKYFIGGYFISLLFISHGIRGGSYHTLIASSLVAVLSFFAIYQIFILLQQRRRKTFDLTIIFWRWSFLNAITSICIWWVQYFFQNLNLLIDPQWDLIMGVSFYFSILSFMVGMLLKIIPFLVWFHLQAHLMNWIKENPRQPFPSLPLMGDFISETVKTNLFYLWNIIEIILLISIITQFFSISFSYLLKGIALFLFFAFFHLLWILYYAIKLSNSKRIFKKLIQKLD